MTVELLQSALEGGIPIWACTNNVPNTLSTISTTKAMPPIRPTKSYTLANSPANNLHLHQLAQTYGGIYSQKLNRSLPYPETSIRKPSMHFVPTLPNELITWMEEVEDRAVGDTTKKKDGSRIREYLKFCEGLGIGREYAIPALHNLVAAWAASFAGRYCRKTVGAKILAIKKLHDRLSYHWDYSDKLHRMVKGIEQM
jgi:hypothetical protein